MATALEKQKKELSSPRKARGKATELPLGTPKLSHEEETGEFCKPEMFYLKAGAAGLSQPAVRVGGKRSRTHGGTASGCCCLPKFSNRVNPSSS